MTPLSNSIICLPFTAQIALNDSGPFGGAIEFLPRSDAIRIGASPEPATIPPTCIPFFVRGPAYPRRTSGRSGYRGVSENLELGPEWLSNEPIGALALLGLARAHAISGETKDARTSYNSFLTLWKNADSGFPFLSAVQAEVPK